MEPNLASGMSQKPLGQAMNQSTEKAALETQADHHLKNSEQKNDDLKHKTEKEKLQEYENMLRILYKQRDASKIKALVAELKHLDPENKSAEKWLKKAEKLEKGGGLLTSFLSKLIRKKQEKNETVQSPESAQKTNDSTVDSPKVDRLNSIKTSFSQTGGASSQIDTVAMSKAPIVSSQGNGITTPSASGEISERKAGNTFTRMFGKNEFNKSLDEKSIIDRIVARTEKKATQPSVKKEKKPFNLLGFSKIFANFTAIFIVFSAGFLTVEFLDQGNTVLGLVGVQENTGQALHNAAVELEELKSEEVVLQQDIANLQANQNDPRLKTIESIVNERVNWPETFRKIDEVTESVFEYYDFFGYVVYENFSLDADGRTVRVTGTLSDPTGFNLTSILKLADAFEHYPNLGPEDPTRPYFEDFQELTTLSKSYDAEAQRYVSKIQFTFSLPDQSLTPEESTN